MPRIHTSASLDTARMASLALTLAWNASLDLVQLTVPVDQPEPPSMVMASMALLMVLSRTIAPDEVRQAQPTGEAGTAVAEDPRISILRRHLRLAESQTPVTPVTTLLMEVPRSTTRNPANVMAGPADGAGAGPPECALDRQSHIHLRACETEDAYDGKPIPGVAKGTLTPKYRRHGPPQSTCARHSRTLSRCQSGTRRA